MAIQQLPINGETKIINGVSYVYTAANSSWTIGTSVPQSTEIVYSDSLYISGSNGITFADGTKQITAASGSGIDSYARTTANSATTLAQASFDKANTGTSSGIDSYARTTANSATVLSQAAFNAANTASNNVTSIQGVNTTQNTNITLVNQFAQSSYNQANTNATNITAVNNYATSAYGQANTNSNTITLVNQFAQSAYNQANTGTGLAQAAFDKANTGGSSSAGLAGWTVIDENYTVSNNVQLIANTTVAGFTVTLPSSPVTGNTVVITDGSLVSVGWSNNHVTVARNGSTILGYADDLLLNVSRSTATLVYDGGT
jgi:hypothetical protein